MNAQRCFLEKSNTDFESARPIRSGRAQPGDKPKKRANSSRETNLLKIATNKVAKFPRNQITYKLETELSYCRYIYSCKV